MSASTALNAASLRRLPPATQSWLLEEVMYPHARLEQFYEAATRPAAMGVRVNTLAGLSRHQVLERLRHSKAITAEMAERAVLPEGIDDMILFPNRHFQEVTPDPSLPAFVIARLAAEAVMQGAEAYAPGVAAAPAAYGPGMRCNLYGDAVDMFKSRGVTAEPEECLRDHASGRLVFLGLAETLQSRAETFGGAQRGQTLAFLQRVHDLPPLNNILPDLVTLQGLPSSLAAHALDPQPGETILDMCSSPGGKACHVASLMKNTGCVVAVDRTATKVGKIEQLSRRLGLTNVRAVVGDSTKDLPSIWSAQFDRVLLDPTCSALGLRPRLSFAGVTPQYLKKTAAYQRKLLHAAVAALKPGGTLLYSTCTINPMENEGNVAWALSTFPELQLQDLQLPPHLAPPGMPVGGLGGSDASKVARFEGLGDPLDPFTGFFIARFTKR